MSIYSRRLSYSSSSHSRLFHSRSTNWALEVNLAGNFPMGVCPVEFCPTVGYPIVGCLIGGYPIGGYPIGVYP